jgi:LacI family transcriptional regulator
MAQERDITIYDIAKMLDISPSTVSRGLKNHPTVSIRTRKKIVDIAKQMGYRSNNFARNLRKQHTRTIGLIIHELHSEFTISVLAGIEKITTAANYDLIIGHSSESSVKEAANVHNLFNKRVDGLIASLAFDTDNLLHFEPFFRKKIPIVFFDRVEDTNYGIRIVIDNFKAGYDATAHLIQQGCTRIAHSTANLKRNVYADRLNGYKQALANFDLPYNPAWTFINDQSEAAIKQVVHEMVRQNPRPDGIFVTNDFCAAVCIQTLKELGLRIPEDIAVVGFNNDVISSLVEPKITTINYPGIEMGELAGRHLIELLKDPSLPNIPKKVVINSELIIRESSRKKIEIASSPKIRIPGVESPR